MNLVPKNEDIGEAIFSMQGFFHVEEAFSAMNRIFDEEVFDDNNFSEKSFFEEILCQRRNFR